MHPPNSIHTQKNAKICKLLYVYTYTTTHMTHVEILEECKIINFFACDEIKTHKRHGENTKAHMGKKPYLSTTSNAKPSNFTSTFHYSVTPAS